MEPDIVGAPAPSVSQMQLDDELTLFDSRTGTALTLNRTASDVWALADGRSTVEEVISTLARAYGTRPSAIAEEVQAVLESLTRTGVLVASPAR